ncbi:MAG: hypothetical protein IBX43_03445 [Campylobacterales bacterium]|nr:hypothetical protein [Campylobacterales bacterium]
MGKLDFGKLTTISLIFFIVVFFFGGEIKYWYDHKDELQFKLINLVYTKQQYDDLEADEKKLLLDEVSSLCVRKHHTDNLSCTDTAYWLANSMEDKGIESDLAIEWMQSCLDACKTSKPSSSLQDRPGKRTGI